MPVNIQEFSSACVFIIFLSVNHKQGFLRQWQNFHVNCIEYSHEALTSSQSAKGSIEPESISWHISSLKFVIFIALASKRNHAINNNTQASSMRGKHRAGIANSFHPLPPISSHHLHAWTTATKTNKHHGPGIMVTPIISPRTIPQHHGAAESRQNKGKNNSSFTTGCQGY